VPGAVGTSPTPDDRSAAQAPGAGDTAETASAEHVQSAYTPLADDVGESAGPALADDTDAAPDQQGVPDAPSHEPDTAEASPSAQLVVLPATVVPSGERDKQVRRLRPVLSAFCLHLWRCW